MGEELKGEAKKEETTEKKDKKDKKEKHKDKEHKDKEKKDKKEKKEKKEKDVDPEKENQVRSSPDPVDAELDQRKLFKEGQRFLTPPVADATRAFYESLYAEIPESKIAIRWCVENGVMPIDKHKAL